MNIQCQCPKADHWIKATMLYSPVQLFYKPSSHFNLIHTVIICLQLFLARCPLTASGRPINCSAYCFIVP